MLHYQLAHQQVTIFLLRNPNQIRASGKYISWGRGLPEYLVNYTLVLTWETQQQQHTQWSKFIKTHPSTMHEIGFIDKLDPDLHEQNWRSNHSTTWHDYHYHYPQCLSEGSYLASRRSRGGEMYPELYPFAFSFFFPGGGWLGWGLPISPLSPTHTAEFYIFSWPDHKEGTKYSEHLSNHKIYPGYVH